MTPPYLSGWRVGAHRPTFCETKDGGLLFYAPVLAFDWEQRVSLLQGPWPFWWMEKGELTGGQAHRRPPPAVETLQRAYRDAITSNLERIVERSDARYLVTERGYDVDTGTIAWSSDRFMVREIGPGPG